MEFFEAGFGAVERVQALMSFHDTESELSRLNRNPVGEWLELDSLTAAVLHAARELEQISEGVFNAATESETSGCFAVEENQACRLADTLLDLGGIAKGFAVDLAVQAILALDPKASGLVNAGGDLKVFGPKSQVIQLRAETSEGPILRPVSCKDLALATSSIRRSRQESATHRFRGTRFLSGKTVSVLAKDCLWADALTKIALMGSDSVIKRCLEKFGAQALVFDRNGRPIEAA